MFPVNTIYRIMYLFPGWSILIKIIYSDDNRSDLDRIIHISSLILQETIF